MYIPGGSVNVTGPNVGLNGPNVGLNGPHVDLNGPGFNNNYGPGHVNVGLPGANAGGYSTTTTTSYRSVGPTMGSYNVVEPGLNLNANSAGYNINAPRFDVNGGATGYNVNGPRLDLNAPRLDLAAPQVDLAGPRFDVNAPRVDLNAPMVDVNGPRLDLNSGYNATGYNGSAYEINEGAGFVEQDDMTSSGCCNRRNRTPFEFGHKRIANEFAGNIHSLCCRRCCVGALIAAGLLALAGLAVGIWAAATGGKFVGSGSSSSTSTPGSGTSGSNIVNGVNVGPGGVARIAGGYLGGQLVNGVLVVPITATPQRTFLIYGTEMPCNQYNNNSVTTTPSYHPNCNQVSTKIIQTTPLTTTPFRVYYPAVIGGNGLSGIIVSGADSIMAASSKWKFVYCAAIALIAMMRNVRGFVAVG